MIQPTCIKHKAGDYTCVDCLGFALDMERGLEKELRRQIGMLKTALQPLANLRVEANGAVDGPDADLSVAVGRNKAVVAAIPLGVYDSVLPARHVYAARRTLAALASPAPGPVPGHRPPDFYDCHGFERYVCECGTVDGLHEFGRHSQCEYFHHHCDPCHERGICTSHG